MRNPAPYIRETLVALLNETITYDGVQVPCYAGEGEVTPYQILVTENFGRIREIENRDCFTGRYEQEIQVISEQETNRNQHINAIADEVLQLLIPTPKTSPLTGNDVFHVTSVKAGTPVYRVDTSGEGSFINILILRINFLITQKQNGITS